MTAGSCSVAISRSRPPQCEHARTSIANARCMRAAQLQAREPLFTRTPSGACDQRRRRDRGLGRHASVRDHAPRQRARGASTPWQISRLVSGRGVIAAKRSNNSSGSNTSSRVPSCHACLQLQRDAAVAPQPQALLREGRTQDISAQTLQPRAIVSPTPTRWRAGRTRPGAPAAPRATSRSPCRARRRAAAPAPPRVSPAPRAPAPTPRRSPPARETRPRADPPAPSRRRPAPGRGAPAAAAPGGESSPAPPRPRRRSALAPDETPARPRALR